MHPLHRRIEAEYGEPFWDVVRGYASQGCSRRETGRLLGYRSEESFIRLLQRHPEIVIEWPAAMECQCRLAMVERARDPSSDLHAQLSENVRKARAVNPTFIRVTLDGITATLSEHMRRLGGTVKLSGVSRRIKRGWPVRAAIVTPCTRHRNTGQKGIRNHPWKQEATQC